MIFLHLKYFFCPEFHVDHESGVKFNPSLKLATLNLIKVVKL